ncbi:MAG: serine hydrolase [Gemmatimonadaceae bacterium]
MAAHERGARCAVLRLAPRSLARLRGRFRALDAHRGGGAPARQADRPARAALAPGRARATAPDHRLFRLLRHQAAEALPGRRRGERRGAGARDRAPAPFAGVHSTARDLFRFARALRSGLILRPETVELLFSPKPEAGNWGYGFDILDAERGLVGHGGSYTGMSNSLDMFTRRDYTSVILSNYAYARSPLREAVWAILP